MYMYMYIHAHTYIHTYICSYTGAFLRIRNDNEHRKTHLKEDNDNELNDVLLSMVQSPLYVTFKNDDIFDVEKGLGLRCGRDFKDIAQNFSFFFCRRCYVYNCNEHSDRNRKQIIYEYSNEN